MGLTTYRISDFLGGINLVDDDSEIKTNELAVSGVAFPSQNVVPISSGQGIGVRDGCDKLSVVTGPALPTAGRIVHIKVFNKFFSPVLFWSTITGGLGVYNPSNGTNVEIQNSTTYAFGSGYDFEYVVDEVAGTNYIYCYYVRGSGALSAFRSNLVGAAVAWPGFPVLNGGCIKVWKNRMIVTDGARLHFSDIGNPESFPVNNFIDIKSIDDDGDPITALEVLGENLLVFKSNSVWSVYDSTNFTNRRLFAVGAANYKATVAFEDRVYWVGKRGVYSTSGEDLVYESRKLEPIFTDDSHALAINKQTSTYNSSDIGMYLSSTVDGKIFLGDSDYGTNLWVGYSTLRDENGEMPWYLLKNSSGGLFSAAEPSEARAVNIAGTIVTRPPITVAINPATGLQYFHKVMDPLVTTDNTPSANFTIAGRAALGWHLGVGDDEKYERLRKVVMMGKGTITVDVLKDYDVATSVFNVTLPAAANSTVMRAQPGIKGKTHRVVLSGSDFEISELLLKYRGDKENR